MKNKFGWGGVAVHALFFLPLCSTAFQALGKSAKAAEDALAYTLILLWPDVPAMILTAIFTGPVKKFSPAAFTPAFLILLFIFGSLQWYGLGMLTGWGWKKVTKSK